MPAPVADNDAATKNYVDNNAGGGNLSDDNPQALGTSALPGVSTQGSRADHVHSKLGTYEDPAIIIDGGLI